MSWQEPKCCVSGSAFILVGWIRIRTGNTDPDPYTGGQNDPQKWRKFKFWRTGCFLLRDEDFSCSLGVLYGGLGISKLQFLIKKIWFYSSCKFFQFFISKPWIWMDPDPHWQQMLNPDPHLNQCVSATLAPTGLDCCDHSSQCCGMWSRIRSDRHHLPDPDRDQHPGPADPFQPKVS